MVTTRNRRRKRPAAARARPRLPHAGLAKASVSCAGGGYGTAALLPLAGTARLAAWAALSVALWALCAAAARLAPPLLEENNDEDPA
jgi:hypothetical protein